MRPRDRRLVALVGPTASGKTDLAVQAVEQAGCPVEIVILDSRQLYRGLDLGTGKPDAEQRRRVPHHLLDCLELHETPDAMDYRRRVEAVASEILARGAVVLLVGGAGFYLRALREGFHDFEYTSAELGRVRERLSCMDDETLRESLRSLDPRTAERLHPNDRYRISRALELCELSGRTASELEAEFRARPILDASFKVALLMPAAEILHERIAQRTGLWLEAGWQEEIRDLLDSGIDPAAAGLDILGYRQVGALLRGEMTREECLEQIVVATRRYARAQRTWFRKEQARLNFAAHDAAAVQALAALLRECAAAP